MVPHTWRKQTQKISFSIMEVFICNRCGLIVNCHSNITPDQTVRQHVKSRRIVTMSECCDEMLVMSVTQS